MGTAIIGAILAVIIVLALLSSKKHFKGEGGCCGGGSSEPEKKKLTAPKIGEKEVVIEGMHCDHCKNSVEHAVNSISGAACKVNLRKNTAKISYSEPIDDEEIRSVIESQGFKVKEIRNPA